MPTFVDFLRLFKLTAFRANGTPVVGATVRMFNAANVEVTSSFFAGVSSITDSVGIVSRLFAVQAGLPAGQYTIQVQATGFQPWSLQTTTDFIGAGDFTANLIRATVLGNYSVTEPTTRPASSMIPVVTEVSSPSQFEWEYIRCRVENPDGSSSVIEAPVEKANDVATIDFRNRIKLGIRPLLVPSGLLTRPDTDFSTVVEVDFSSLSPEGESTISFGETDTFTLPVAHTLPPEKATDLSTYVTATNRKWIVPFVPVIAFRGYYRDVMVWLPVASVPGYVLTCRYYNGAGTQVSSTTHALTHSPYVQRIQLETNPDATVVRSVLSITAGAVVIAEPLTVLYRD